MTANALQPISPEQVMASGLKRISAICDVHGITSPEVFAACERWGQILDDVNFPDSSCKNCGMPVKHNHAMNWWYHVDDNGGTRACKTHAASEATPQVTIMPNGRVNGMNRSALTGRYRPVDPYKFATTTGRYDSSQWPTQSDFENRLNDPNVNPRLY